LRPSFRARPKPFLDAARREWQFAAFAWLLRHGGGYPNFLESVAVLPTAEHFPDRGMSGHAGVSALFRQVRDHAGMADWPCMVEPRTEGECLAAPADGIRVIRYDPALRAAGPLVAHFARELARYLVESIDEDPPGGRGFMEPAIEIAAVFMGFGVFVANAALESPVAHLNEGECVHALAMYCLLGSTPPATLDPHLNPHLRKYLRLAVLDLRQHEAAFQRLRSVRGLAADRASQARC
jgi:hypothetical protein